jgi:DNA-directed RNA polymerase specialized sigma24 family protein
MALPPVQQAGVSPFRGLHDWPVRLEKDIVISINHELKEEFEGRFSRCRNSLYFLALRTLGNVGEAEEAMENSYRKARRAVRRFTSDGEFGSWMIRQLINEIVEVANRRMMESSEMSEAEYPEAR